MCSMVLTLDLSSVTRVVRCACSCPDESTCTFLYRKPSSAPLRTVVLRAPDLAASEGDMDDWLQRCAESLDGVAGLVRFYTCQTCQNGKRGLCGCMAAEAV